MHKLIRSTLKCRPVEMYRCDICEQTFGRSFNMMRHRKKHGIMEGPPCFTEHDVHSCTICHKQFNKKYNMLRHMNSHSMGETSQMYGLYKIFPPEGNIRTTQCQTHRSQCCLMGNTKTLSNRQCNLPHTISYIGCYGTKMFHRFTEFQWYLVIVIIY